MPEQKEYENREWLTNTVEGTLRYELHFTEFYDDETILIFTQDVKDPERFPYTSKFLNVESDDIIADSVQDAIEQFENMIKDHINDEISRYEEMLKKFEAEK